MITRKNMTDNGKYYASFVAKNAADVAFLKGLLGEEKIEYIYKPGPWGDEEFSVFSLQAFYCMELYPRHRDALIGYLALRGDNTISFSMPLRDTPEDKEWYRFNVGYRPGFLSFRIDGIKNHNTGDIQTVLILGPDTLPSRNTRKIAYSRSNVSLDSRTYTGRSSMSLSSFIESTIGDLEKLSGQPITDKGLREKAKLLLIYYRLGILDQARPDIAGQDIHWFERFGKLDLNVLMGDDKYFGSDPKISVL